MGWFSILTGGSHLIAGMVLATAFSLYAWIFFYQLVAKRFGSSLAMWALLFLIVFLSSLFYQFIWRSGKAMVVWTYVPGHCRR